MELEKRVARNGVDAPQGHKLDDALDLAIGAKDESAMAQQWRTQCLSSAGILGSGPGANSALDARTTKVLGRSLDSAGVPGVCGCDVCATKRGAIGFLLDAYWMRMASVPMTASHQLISCFP